MALLIKNIVHSYHYINDELGDPRTQDYLFISSPWPTLAILVFYFQFTKKLGQNLMANRSPMKLERIIQVYNVIQIILNCYICYKASTLGWLNDYSFTCQPIDYSWSDRAVEITRICHLYFIVKLLDLLDTIFMVLRKKHNQVSFLHVYHHIGITVGAWVGTKFIAGGHGTFLGWLNSFVHAVMYTHYLVMSLKITKPWWKEHITQLQLLQFVWLTIHFTLPLLIKGCDYPAWPCYMFIPQNLFMIVLFSDFYYKNYIKKKEKL